MLYLLYINEEIKGGGGGGGEGEDQLSRMSILSGAHFLWCPSRIPLEIPRYFLSTFIPLSWEFG